MDTDNDSNSNSFDMEDLWVPQLPHGVLMAIGVDREDVTSLANNPQAAGSSNNTEAEQSQNKNTGVRTLMPSAIGVGGDQHANGHGKEDTYKTPAPKKRAAQSHMRSLLADSPDDFSPLRLDEGSASRVTGQLDTPWRQPDQRNRFITPLHARALNLPVGWSPSLETPLPNGKQRAVTPGHIASLLRRRQFQSLAAQESPTAWATVGPRSRSPEGTPPVMPAIAPAEQIRVLHEESRMSNVEKPKALSADRALGRLLANRLGNARRETSVKENDFSSLTPGVKVSGTGVKWLTPFLGQQKPKPLAKSNTRQIRSAEGRPKRMLLTPRTADPSPSKNDFDDMFANQFVREPSLTAVPSLHNALQGEAAKRNADQAMRDETPLNAKRKRRGGTVTKIQDIVGPEQIQPLELSDIIGTVPTTYVSSNQSRKPNKRRKSKGDFPKLTVQSHCVTPSEDLTTQAAPTGDDLSFWATTIPTRVPKPNFDVVGTSTITASGRSTTASIAIGRAEQNPFQERPQEERKRGRKLRHSDPQGNVRRSERIRRGESGCSSTKEIKHMKAKPGTARTPAPAPASPVARRSAPYSNEHTRRLKKEALDTFESIFSSSPLSDVSVLSSPESVYSKKSDAGRKRGMMIKAASPCLPSSSQSAHRELCAMSSDLFNAAGGSEPHSPPRPSPVYDAKATNNGPGAAPILISSSPAKAQSPVAREIPARLSSPQSKSPDDNDRVDIADLMNILEIPSITPPNKRKRDLGSKAPYRNGLLLQTSELDSIPSDVESDGDAAHTVAVGDGVPSTATAAEAPANSMIVETQEEDDFPHIGSPALLEPTARSQGIEMEGSLDATCSQQLLLISSPVGSNHVELNLIASIAETIKHEHIDTQSSVTQMTSITDDVDTQSVVTQKTTIIDNIETQSSVTQKTTIIDNADTQSTATQKTTIIDTGQDVIPATLSLTPRLNRAEVKMKQAVIDVPSSPESQTQGSECDSPSIFRRFPMMATGSVGSLNLVMPTRLGKEVGTDHDSDRTESLPQREDDELIHVLDADDDIRARSATLDIEDKREMGLPVHSSPPPSRHVQDFDDTQEDTQDGGDDHRYGVPLTLEVAVETAEDASTRSATPGVAEKQAMGPLAHSSPVRSQHVQDFNDTQDETREAHDEYHLSGPRALETTDVREEAVNGRTQDNRTAAGKISSKAPVPGGHAARSPPVDDLKDQAATILASRSPVTCAASPKCVAHADVDDASVMSAGSSPIIAASQASLTGAVNDSFKLPNQYDEAERTQRAKAVRWDTDEVEHPPLGVQSDVDDDDEYGDDYGHSMLSAVHGITQKLKVEADFPRTQPGFYDAYTIEDDDISASFERALNQTNTQPAQSVPLSAPIPPPFHAPAFKDQDPEPAEQGLINFAFASGKQLKPNMSTIRRFAQFVDQELSADANPMCASGGGLGSGRASVSFAPKSLGDLRREVRGWRTPLGEGDGMTVVKEVPHAADEGTNTPMDYREPPLNETAPGRSGGQRDRHGEGDENCHHEFPPLIQDFAISKDRDSPTTISGDDYSILAEPFGAARIEAAHDVSFEVPVHRINGNQSAVPEATVAHNTGASEYYGGQISDTVQSEHTRRQRWNWNHQARWPLPHPFDIATL
ncbi:uncharacterized protein EV422DRAFT_249839 [Fimicolochytrium jonesii]|uniref:uncharacterized protein n=1 Tax=Fimicolochytrium jonesii TaxID=1396493 RepID=UPI0022FECB4D|nr:uncharacterized protein EV422DRAFT_249839 [Fimicolochytrium jonesii]KAI8825204.1 hypothetical protein EV422DRAFT_249839 [Fimicolochytrium jonesii]